VCSRSGTKLIASVEPRYNADDDDAPFLHASTITRASLEFGVVDTNGEGLLIDVSVASLITTNITQVDEDDDDFYVDTSGEVIVAAKLYADCIGGLSCTGITPIDSTTPGGLTMAFVGTYGGSIFGNANYDNE